MLAAANENKTRKRRIKFIQTSSSQPSTPSPVLSPDKDEPTQFNLAGSMTKLTLFHPEPKSHAGRIKSKPISILARMNSVMSRSTPSPTFNEDTSALQRDLKSPFTSVTTESASSNRNEASDSRGAMNSPSTPPSKTSQKPVEPSSPDTVEKDLSDPDNELEDGLTTNDLQLLTSDDEECYKPAAKRSRSIYSPMPASSDTNASPTPISLSTNIPTPSFNRARSLG